MTQSQSVYSEIPQVHTKVGLVSLFISLLLKFISVTGQVCLKKKNPQRLTDRKFKVLHAHFE